jgi:hypothetical protein
MVSIDTLKKVGDAKSIVTGPPTAEGVKGTTVEVAKGAAMGAATGGWVGAARGAAVSFAQTRAGRRIIAGTLGAVAVCSLIVPSSLLFVMYAAGSSAAYGNDFRAGQSAVESGQESAAVTRAKDTVDGHDVPWPLYLALTTVQVEPDINVGKLRDAIAKSPVRSLANAGVYVEGKGLVPGETDQLKTIAAEEKTAFVAALTQYGLDDSQANRVYALALKWAYGQTEECATGESSPGAGGGASADDGSPIQLEDGTTVTLSEVQLGNAQKIIGFASKINGITEDAIIISLMAAMTESALMNYANSNVPASLGFPHDAVGSDHDSVGFWQMRQHWGTIAELMDIEYQTKAFFGGPEGPNGGSPRGLFDIPGWDTMPKGEAAQAVEVSAFPDRYAANEPLARALLKRLGDGLTFCDGGTGIAGEAGHPLGDPKYLVVSGYGPRVPGAGSSNHKGIDFGAGCDTPIYAIADGKVVSAGLSGGWGNAVVIDHGGGLETRSAHMPYGGNWAQAGSMVKKGDQIGTVGTTGNSSGCHLHFETMMNGEYVDPGVVLKDMGVRLIWSSESNGIPPGAEMG